MTEQPLGRSYALICLATGAGIRFTAAPWTGSPEEVLVESRKRRGTWRRNGVVSQQRASEL